MSDRRYKCHYIDNGLNFEKNTVFHCCKSAHFGGGRMPLVTNYNGGDLDWGFLFSIKNEIKLNLLEGCIPESCQGCSQLWEVSDLYQPDLTEWNINIVEVNHFNKCNSSCTYCQVLPKKGEKFVEEYEIFKIFKYMFENNILREGGYIMFGGGEPTLLKGFDNLLELCYKNISTRYMVHSSGIKYSDAIGKGLSRYDMDVTISIDAGTRETYKKIKRVDCFNKVCDNIKKYIKNSKKDKQKIRVKYIIIPTINDNFEEINKWYELIVKKIGVEFIFLDIEKEWFVQHRDNIPEHIINLIRHIKSRAEQDNITLNYYEQVKLISESI